MIKTYPINELADIVPMANKIEQQVLENEIAKEKGLILPIVLWKGEIIDGRCRQLACVKLGIEMKVTELDSNLSYFEVMGKVKALNSRRNMTITQKVISAVRQSLKARNKLSVKAIAKEWGIGDKILKNGRFIAKYRPEFIEPLFNGKTVTITNNNGYEIQTNKITSIYAYIRKIQEQAVKNDIHAWDEDSYINTVEGKEWYYQQLTDDKIPIDAIAIKMKYAELANYKYHSYVNNNGEIKVV